MAHATDVLHTAIAHWQMDAATGAKDATELRNTMRNLAAHIDNTDLGRMSGQERAKLQNRLESMAHVVRAPLQDAPPASDASAGHISVFA